MDKKIPANLINDLRHQLASAISDFKAYDVPGVCQRLGLADGSEEEAFQSKYKYAQKRVVSLKTAELLRAARELSDETEFFYLQEAMEKIADVNKSEITKLTRRRLIKLLEAQDLASEVEEFEFIQSTWPIAQMQAPGQHDDRSLEEYLIQHTIRNDDLTRQDVLDSLGLLTCSSVRLFQFLEQVTSAEFQHEDRQKELASQIDQLLRHDGYTLSESGRISGSPIFQVRELPKGSPSDGDISATLSAFEPDQIGTRWQDALQSRSTDPERAITLARTLLEDVCKWILNEAGKTWEETDDLPALYKKLSKVLDLAPDDHTEQIFKQILGSCQSVVSALGALRNKLSDAHSIGPKRVRPAARHAELAVNLAGTMATFLVSTWKAKKGKEGKANPMEST